MHDSYTLDNKELIAIPLNNFARYFSETYAPNSCDRASSLYDEYLLLRESYFDFPIVEIKSFDT